MCATKVTTIPNVIISTVTEFHSPMLLFVLLMVCALIPIIVYVQMAGQVLLATLQCVMESSQILQQFATISTVHAFFQILVHARAVMLVLNANFLFATIRILLTLKSVLDKVPVFFQILVCAIVAGLEAIVRLLFALVSMLQIHLYAQEMVLVLHQIIVHVSAVSHLVLVQSQSALERTKVILKFVLHMVIVTALINVFATMDTMVVTVNSMIAILLL